MSEITEWYIERERERLEKVHGTKEPLLNPIPKNKQHRARFNPNKKLILAMELVKNGMTRKKACGIFGLDSHRLREYERKLI